MSGAKHRIGARRATLIGLLVVAAIVVAQQGALNALAAPPVDSPGPPSADGVRPVVADTPSSGNDCTSLGFAHGVSLTGDGQVSSGALTITVTGSNDPTGFADWSSTLPIHGVYVKGGPSGGNLFGTPGGDTGDRDVHTPRKANGAYYAVSHVAFCWNDVVPEPDVVITKANDPDGAIQNGGSITYTLTSTNEGDADATAVEVTDQLPEGVAFVEATAGCSEAAGLVTCDVGEIGAGASLDVTLTVTVDDTFCGTIVNHAAVSASNESGDTAGNNASNDVTNVVGCPEPTAPDLQVSKTSAAGELLHDGDSFLYTITVTNVGGTEATGVELVDVLPSGALNVGIPPFPTLLGDACTVTSSVPEPGGVPFAVVRCGPASLGAGDSATVRVRVIVTGDVCGEVTNVVDADADNEPAANVGADNHAEATDAIACVPRIRLQKGGPPLAHLGDTITYVFAVTNTGGVDLSSIELSDPECGGGSPSLVEDADGDDVLTVGEEWDFACGYTITTDDGDPIHNVATVTGHHQAGTVTDTDAHDVSLLHPSIELRKTATPTAGPPGTVITYTYAVTNTGDTPLFDVSVDDDTLGHIGAITRLAVAQTIEVSAATTLGSSPITNTAVAGGSDRLGAFVSDEDSATVTVVAGEGGGDGTGGGSPFTGSDTGVLPAWIVALVALGSALLMGSRRRRALRGER